MCVSHPIQGLIRVGKGNTEHGAVALFKLVVHNPLRRLDAFKPGIYTISMAWGIKHSTERFAIDTYYLNIFHIKFINRRSNFSYFLKMKNSFFKLQYSIHICRVPFMCQELLGSEAGGVHDPARDEPGDIELGEERQAEAEELRSQRGTGSGS